MSAAIPDGAATAMDHRFMAAAIRLSERHVGLTATNPSVATLIVRDDGQGARITGRGITAIGGRPHAEAAALGEAGALARGATAYVTLEPCAHHGRTPPCAEALVRSGVARVVSAAADPDPRVNGRGHSILREAGIIVVPGVMAREAERAMSGYLSRLVRKRPEVTLKLALSEDGFIGRRGEGPVAITGPTANLQTHLLRARHDAIIVGAGTIHEDDPLLTCRLPGLAHRSPLRIVLDPELTVPSTARIVETAAAVPTSLAVLGHVESERRASYQAAGCRFLGCVADPATGRIALPELLEDLAASGVSSVLVEGGARTTASFIEQELVDRLILYRGRGRLGHGIAAPIDFDVAARTFAPVREGRYGEDLVMEFERRQGGCSPAS